MTSANDPSGVSASASELRTLTLGMNFAHLDEVVGRRLGAAALVATGLGLVVAAASLGSARWPTFGAGEVSTQLDGPPVILPAVHGKPRPTRSQVTARPPVSGRPSGSPVVTTARIVVIPTTASSSRATVRPTAAPSAQPAPDAHSGKSAGAARKPARHGHHVHHAPPRHHAAVKTPPPRKRSTSVGPGSDG
jgi:hypothetical protein